MNYSGSEQELSTKNLIIQTITDPQQAMSKKLSQQKIAFLTVCTVTRKSTSKIIFEFLTKNLAQYQSQKPKGGSKSRI
jgi:hypothetical protein